MPNQRAQDQPDPLSPASQATAQAPSDAEAASVYPEAATFSAEEAELESIPIAPDDASSDTAADRERAGAAAASKADDRPASEAAQRAQDHQLATGEEPPA